MNALAPADAASLLRLRLDVTGAVQGVGFRPFVYRLAVAEGLAGHVGNTVEGATLEVEGTAAAIKRFLERFDREMHPPMAIASRRTMPVGPSGALGFFIAPSQHSAHRGGDVLPDLVTCPDCLAEIADPADRRHGYAFTTCMHCGPRFSVIEAVPYDRARTAMRHFPMCPACAAEYADPASRRFHAETNACPACGPRLTLLDRDGVQLAVADMALARVIEALRAGAIVAVKGLGGFQLLVDARDEVAVAALRGRKRRPAKPFAVMVRDLNMAGALAGLDAEEVAALASAAGPIVLVRARANAGLAASVAPGSPLLGLMLPTTPLHRLLLRELGFPLVATSGNRGGEPIVTETAAAVARLTGIADLFLVHDRPIVRAVDDSVVRIIAGTSTVLRAARGLAPAVFRHAETRRAGLALGGHQKSALALELGDRVVLGPHIGDLDTEPARAALERGHEDLAGLYRMTPHWHASDQHADYFSTRLADRLGTSAIRVPHHVAHVLAGCLDNGLDGPVLGVAWDGTGDGGDGTIWGGEILVVDGCSWHRRAHLLPFALPGGEAAARAPWRSALGLLAAIHGDAVFDMTTLPIVAALSAGEIRVMRTMLKRSINAPRTTSAGRMFDAVAALLGLCQRSSYEGEAGMAVEYAAARTPEVFPLTPIALGGIDPIVMDWRPPITALIDGLASGVPVEALALGLHHALADAIVGVAERVEINDVVLTGGCFQNAVLAELARDRLVAAGFAVHQHRRIPPNDGGLAAGQAVFAAYALNEENA